LARRCRELIEQHAPATEKENFLAVVQVLARLRYNEPEIFAVLGGKEAMIESPLIQEIVAEAVHDTILDFLRARFGDPSPDLEGKLRAVSDKGRLSELTRIAAICPNLDAFRQALS
jgi:hypothetical protein